MISNVLNVKGLKDVAKMIPRQLTPENVPVKDVLQRKLDVSAYTTNSVFHSRSSRLSQSTLKYVDCSMERTCQSKVFVINGGVGIFNLLHEVENANASYQILKFISTESKTLIDTWIRRNTSHWYVDQKKSKLTMESPEARVFAATY